MAKKKTTKVCYHCGEPRWHRDGCLNFIAACSAARQVKRSERTREVAGTLDDFPREVDQEGSPVLSAADAERSKRHDIIRALSPDQHKLIVQIDELIASLR